MLTRNERFAFTSNTPNDSISSYRVGRDGSLELLESQVASTGLGSGPADSALSRDNRFLFVLTPGVGTIGGFRVDEGNGALEP